MNIKDSNGYLIALGVKKETKRKDVCAYNWNNVYGVC